MTIGLQRERVRVVQEVPAFYWRCEACGWLGTGLFSQQAAIAESGRHANEAHGLTEATVTRVDWAIPDVAYDAERIGSLFSDGSVERPGAPCQETP